MLSFPFIVAIAFMGAMQATQPQPNDLAPRKDVARGRGTNIGVNVPQPMKQEDFDLYAGWLNLSEPQMIYARQFFDRYRSAVQATLEESVNPLWELSYAAPEVSNTSAEFGVIVGELSKKEKQLLSKIRDLDEAFFAEFDAILAEQQKPQLLRVRWHRQRHTCMMKDRWFSVDLVDWLRQQQVDVEDDERVAAILRVYEAEITPQMVRIDERKRDSRVEMVDLLVEIGAASRAGNQAAIDAAHERRREISLEIAKLQRQLLLRNDRLIEEVSALNLIGQEQLLAMYRARVYYDAFPDPLDPTGLFNEFGRAPFDQTTLEAISAMRQQAAAQIEQINKELMLRSVQWREEFMSTGSSEGEPQYVRDMRTLRDKRWDADVDWVKRIAAVAVPPTGSPLQKHLEMYLAEAKAARAASTVDHYPLR